MFKPIVLVLFFGIALGAVAKKDRVIDSKLSDKTPGSQDYDNEAFLGKEQAKTFKDLKPEESQRRLRIICERIDKNEDGNITEDELKDWIVFTQTRYIEEDAAKQFGAHDEDKDGKIHWDEYNKVTYGFLDDPDVKHEEPEHLSYDQMKARDKRRWGKADKDGDNSCDKEEFKAFLHPEEFHHMKDVVVQETMDDIDKNKDGYVDLEEYIGDMYNKDEGGSEPEWVQTEREQFSEYRDKNKDNKMDLEELKDWILPSDYDHPKAEALHLFSKADDNKDGVLSFDEILKHHDDFVGSQATDWGDALTRHDEF